MLDDKVKPHAEVVDTKLDEGEVICCEFVVACRDPPTLH